MIYCVKQLNDMSGDELEKIINDDADNDSELLFALESELMELLRTQAFADSETFGELDAETEAERSIRLLVESLDFMNTLAAINALNQSED